MAYQNVIDALERNGCNPTASWNGSVMATCPSHPDNRPSLSVKEGDDGRALVYCFAGCDTVRDIVPALGLEVSDLSPGKDGGAVGDVYDYTDEGGNPLVRVVRYVPKGFTQLRYADGQWVSGLGDTRRVPYRLPDVLKAAAAGEPIYICEGEKDAEAIRGLGACATTNLGGANNWRDEYNDYLRGGKLYIVGDNDDAGRERVEKVAASLLASRLDSTILFPREGKDAFDHIFLYGFGLMDFVEELPDLSVFEPLQWETYEHVTTEWLYEPYLPRAKRVLAFGSAGSLKSLWAIWVAARLSNEGKKVAYFSLEMTQGEVAKRLQAANATPENLMLFQRLSLNNPQHAMYMQRALKDCALVVIDSWSAAHKGADNEEVARLDNEVFLPLVEKTGATLLIIDNTGHAAVTNDGVVKMQHARGASAKGDKMDVTIWFDRPFDDNNYTTKLTVKKMRLDEPIPAPKIITTPQDRIEFYEVGKDGLRGDALWPYEGKDGTWQEHTQLMEKLEAVEVTPEAPSVTTPTAPSVAPPADEAAMTPKERRQLARIKDMFKAVEMEAV